MHEKATVGHMCGRYRIKDPAFIREAIRRLAEGEIALVEFAARYNVPPQTDLPVVLKKDGSAKMQLMRWGLVPYWETSSKPRLAPINARSGEAFAKPIFRQAIQKRRCLIPADGFYEWPKIEADFKQPAFFSLAGERPFFFAGIYENAVEGLRPATFTLFTTEPNALLLRLPHERMPVILEEDRANEWMCEAPIAESAFKELCRTYPAEKMQSWPVSSLINKPANDGPQCCAPVSAESPLPPRPSQGIFEF